jgi:hypothetical protein
MYIPVLKGDKCGYIDVDGNIKIPFNFEYAGFFSDNGLAPAVKDSLFGFINRQGEWQIQPQFNFAFPFFEGLAKVTFNGNTNGFIKSDGTIAYVINDSLFHDVHFRYHNSTVEASTHFQRSYAVLDTQGVTLFEVEADDCLFLNENYFFLRYYSQRFDSIKIIDMKGVTVFKSDQFDWVSFSDKTYQVCCKTDSGGKCLLSPDFTVEDCYPPYLDIFGDLHDDRQSFKFKNSNKVGYLNKKGEMVIDTLYDLGYDFNHGLAAVSIDDKLGFIDRNGKLQIPFNSQWDHFRSIDGISMIYTLSDSILLINNHSRKEIWRMKYDPSFNQILDLR